MEPSLARPRLTRSLIAVLSVCAIILVTYGSTLTAEEEASDEWELVVAPYAWFTSIGGEADLGRVTGPIDASFGDVFDDLNLAFMGQLEVRKYPFGLYVNPVYAKLNTTSSVGPASLNTTLKLAIVDFAGFYRVGPWEFGTAAEEGFPKAAFEPYLGGRFIGLDAELDFKRIPTLSGSKGWIDPIFGARMGLDFTKHFNLLAQADIGGFGASSHLTGQTMLLLGYRFDLFGQNNANVLFGYRGIYTDYSQGSGRDEFGLKAWIYGPVLGLAIRF